MHEIGLRVSVPIALGLKGAALLALGEADAAYETLQEARTTSQEVGERLWRWRILAALAEIEAGRGDTAEAEELRRQAREVIEYIADHAGSPALKASFLDLPEVRALISSP